MPVLIHKIEGICIGQLVRRYKRFLADVLLPDSTAKAVAQANQVSGITTTPGSTHDVSIEATGASVVPVAAAVATTAAKLRRTRARSKAVQNGQHGQEPQSTAPDRSDVQHAATAPTEPAAASTGKRRRAAHEEPAVALQASVAVVQPSTQALAVAAAAATVEGATRPATIVHCPNTGPMTGLLDLPLAQVVCSIAAVPKNGKPTRKYAHTLEAVQPEPGGCWVGVHSALANKLAAKLLEGGHLSQLLGRHTHIQQEVKYGKDGRSRVDFVMTLAQPGRAGRLYVEVKSVTLAGQSAAIAASQQMPSGARLALFPDTVSVRAQKHVEDLMAVVDQGNQAAMLFVVQRNDCTHFSPCEQADPEYAHLVRQAAAKGVQVHALGVDVRAVVVPGAPSALEFWYMGPLEVLL